MITGNEDSMTAVFFHLCGGKWRLRKRSEYSAEVLNNSDAVIGDAHYINIGWALHTRPFAGTVQEEQIEWVKTEG